MYKQFTSNAGHSHLTEGAVGNGYKEHVEALKYNDEFIKQMKAVGYSVTNTTSEAKGAQAVLSEQARKANVVNKDGRLDVSWHFNSASDKKATGVEVLYFDKKELAANVSSAMASALGIRDRGAKERKELYFLRNTNAPAILIEVAFISNTDDMKQATTKRIAVVAAVVEALTGKKASTPNKGKKTVYAKHDLHLLPEGDWKAKSTKTIHEGYAAVLNFDVTDRGFVQVEFQGKKYFYSGAIDPYWYTENPNIRHKAVKDVLTRADPRWGGKASFRMKKGEEVNVIAIVGGWLKCTKSGVIGYLPNDKQHLIKK